MWKRGRTQLSCVLDDHSIVGKGGDEQFTSWGSLEKGQKLQEMGEDKDHGVLKCGGVLGFLELKNSEKRDSGDSGRF